MHRARWLAALLSLIMLLFFGPAVFADEPAQAGHDAGHDGGIFGWALDLFIWTLIVFLTLLFVLTKYAWKPLLEALRLREMRIRSALVEAQEARTETERTKAQFKAEMDQAFAKIPQFMEEARRNGEKVVEEMRAKAVAEIQAERERLRREIEMAKDQALQDLWNQVAPMATLIAANVLSRTLTPEDHQRMFNMAVEEMKDQRIA